jgi:adenine-specific DNA-methyltransferase
MSFTDYHSNYYAHELSRRSASDDPNKLSQSLTNATVDLNPHQIDAALFAFRSPLSRGALLADEVGLGKTIEAGLVLSQLWAEHKRRVLIILPTSLRKQWNRELIEKFFIPSRILETASYNALRRDGVLEPFRAQDEAVICSYNFARTKANDIKQVPWDLIIVDEAHRLRNVYKKGNKIAKTILEATNGKPKLLLTATPLQNNLMELYGLIRFIDPHIFGNEESFAAQFVKQADDRGRLAALRQRISNVCHRTLRRQVTEFVSYTRRLAITQDFTPTYDEKVLYDELSEYLTRDELFGLPASQRQLLTLIFRKLLASSSFAIAGTLDVMLERLKGMRTSDASNDVKPDLASDFETLDETADEWDENDEESVDPLTQGDALEAEIADLTRYRDLATSITQNAKGQALLMALEKGFSKLGELGAPRKAVVFTESRRTQQYLKQLLESYGYAGQVVLFNGTNTEPESRQIYREWLARHAGDDQITGSPTADMRSALVEHFRERASILLATESGAEGINLQFAAQVVNYDLPWNPQRIEQRIGRCHRYGQKFDVVVINFLNCHNAADVRVFELLSEKFNLFNGVFGASDEVLGAIESGVDFEKRIAGIYQTCRTTIEIDSAFAALRTEMDEQINARMKATQQQLLENFDEEVHRRLRTSKENTQQQVSRLEQLLWQMTQHELAGHAAFADRTFELYEPPAWIQVDAPLGRYRLMAHEHDGEPPSIFYRLGHPLALAIRARSLERSLPPASILFDYSAHRAAGRPRIGLVEKAQGQAGWLMLRKLTISALDTEDHLIFNICNERGEMLPDEIGEKLFQLPARADSLGFRDNPFEDTLREHFQSRKQVLLDQIGSRNSQFFDEENEKIERWADDLKFSLEAEIKEMDMQIKAMKRDLRLATNLQAKIDLQRQANDMERRRTAKRRELFEAQDEIDRRKEALIAGVEARLHQSAEDRLLFMIRWEVQ